MFKFLTLSLYWKLRRYEKNFRKYFFIPSDTRRNKLFKENKILFQTGPPSRLSAGKISETEGTSGSSGNSTKESIFLAGFAPAYSKVSCRPAGASGKAGVLILGSWAKSSTIAPASWLLASSDTSRKWGNSSREKWAAFWRSSSLENISLRSPVEKINLSSFSSLPLEMLAKVLSGWVSASRSSSRSRQISAICPSLKRNAKTFPS